MNVAINKYYHAIGITADSIIANVITKNDTELAKALSDAKTAPQNDFTRALIAAIEREQAKRASGGGASTGPTEDEKYATMLKRQNNDWLQKFLLSQEKNLLSKQSGGAVYESEEGLIKRIAALKKELLSRGVNPPPIPNQTAPPNQSTENKSTTDNTIWGMPKPVVYAGGGLLALTILGVGSALIYRAVKSK